MKWIKVIISTFLAKFSPFKEKVLKARARDPYGLKHKH